ncbi:MAG: carbohydrate ABC transporter permease, partial [Firmicutes bacterium]|nr:carbohydrate ABC transporter permease [Bacillota bacterium]
MLHVKNKLVDVLLWIIALAFFAPLLWMFLSAFKTPAEIIQIPPSWTFKPTLSGLTFMVHHGTFWLYVFNSLFITLVSVVIAVVVSYLAAYSFSRFPNKATDFLMFILLSVRMVPGAAVVVPLYLMYTALNWIDSYTGIIAFDIMFSIPFSVWILKGF